MTTLREQSRLDWSSNSEIPTEYELKVGCLQRIANAVELMANRYQQLIDERDRYKRMYERQYVRVQDLTYQRGALRGVITRLKKAKAQS